MADAMVMGAMEMLSALCTKRMGQVAVSVLGRRTLLAYAFAMMGMLAIDAR